MGYVRSITKLRSDTKVRETVRQWFSEFFPKDYPHSVTPNYLRYVQWQALVAIFSSAGGVLSMQALLFAVGLGAATSIPAAAALNWVIKDGLGQLGGMLFANKLSHRFDADPKRFRMISAYSLDASTLIEMLTPLVPQLFLPLAALANIGKNISWLVASSTRAGIHRTFVLQENMADITAKAGSQTMASCLIGTGLGIALSAFAHGQTTTLLLLFAGLSAGHLYCNYRSLLCVQLTTLNFHRLELLLTQFLDSGSVDGPEALAQHETFMRPWGPPFSLSIPLEIGPEFTQLANNHDDLNRILENCAGEHFLISIRFDSVIPRVLLLFLQGASSADVLKAFLVSHMVRKALTASTIEQFDSLVRQCLRRADLPRFEQLLIEKGWNLEHLLLESYPTRLSLSGTDVVPRKKIEQNQ